jgi:hypothetical protein
MKNGQFYEIKKKYEGGRIKINNLKISIEIRIKYHTKESVY